MKRPQRRRRGGEGVRRRQPRNARHHVGQVGIRVTGTDRQPRRHQTDAAHPADDLPTRVNIYQPAQGTLTGAAAVNNFANPITFICGAIQAASRLSADSRPNCACNIWRRSSRTANTTSRRSGRTSSSEPPCDPTRSPTARTGCVRIMFRRNHRRRAQHRAADMPAPLPAEAPCRSMGRCRRGPAHPTDPAAGCPA